MEWRADEGEERFDTISSTTVLSHPLEEKRSRKKKEEKENEKKEEIEEEEEEIFHPLGDFHSVIHDEDSPRKKNGESDTGPLKNTLKSEAITPTHETVLPNFEGWNKMRSRMMREKKENSGKAGRNMMGGKARLRLDLLEDVSGLKKMNVSNEEEYVNEMGQMRETLLYAWKNNKRIESLKLIVEMVSSLSSLGSSSSFYPIQFALVSQVLDTFGGLVYERLLTMCNQDRISRGEGKLPSSFTSNQVPDSVKVVAKNWFIKSSDIADPFARLYVTISITKCQRFFDSSSLNAQWMNLCSLCNSISNQIVAAFTRVYLSKEAMYSNPSDRSVHWKLVNDWMQNLKPVQESVVSPALEWLLSCVSYQCSSREDLAPLWEYSTHSDKRRLFLLPFLRALPPSYLATHIMEATKIVCNPSFSPNGSELKALIIPLITQSTSPQNRALVLRSVWRSTMKLESTLEFVEAASVLPSLVATHFTIDEMSTLCKSIYNRLSGDPSPFQSFISNSLSTFAQCAPSLIPSLIMLDIFHSLLSLLIDPFESSRCASSILSTFVSHHSIGSVRDRVQSNQLLYLCTLLKQWTRMDEGDSSHDLLISSTVDRVSLSDGESVLEWLLSIRSKMSMRERVIMHVINEASALVIRLSSNQGREKGNLKLTRSTLAFIHITIPSIIDPTNRLICIERGLQAALAVAALPQAEALARLSLETLVEIPSVPSVLPSLIPILILIPDSTDRQPLAFINALINMIDRREWKGKEDELIDSLSLVLDGLSALSLKTLPMRMANSWSNDELYGGSHELTESIRELSGGIVERLSVLCTSRPQDSHSFISHLVVRCQPNEWSVNVVSTLLKSLGLTLPVKPQLNGIVRLIRSREEWRRHLQMSFEWSDEEMEVDGGGSEENKKLDEETLNDLSKQYEVSKNELDRLNRIGLEVKRALELRQKMEMCAIREEIGIKLEVKIVTVFDDSLLVYLDVKSNVDWTLEEWDLLLSMHPISSIDGVVPCSSHSYRIPSLNPSSSQSILILQSSDSSRWPIVLRPSLIKRFIIRGDSCYTLNIPLPSLLISNLLIFTPITETRKSGQKCSITLPTEFFIKFIKDSMPVGMGLILNEKVFISTEELPAEKKTRIDIHSTSSTLRQSIISSLEGRSILSYPHYCPSFSPVLPIPSLQSLNALFNSIFPN